MYSDTPRLALPSDTDAISETLAEAMHDDPVTAWVIPSPDRRRLLPGFFRTVVEHILEYGEIFLIREGTGVILVMPPGAPPPTAEQQECYARRMRARIGEFADRTALPIEDLLAAAHPRQADHYYIVFYAVRSSDQGRGTGSALLRHITDRADVAGVGTYLECSTRRSLNLVRRCGFHTRRPIGLPGGLELYPAWREPEVRHRANQLVPASPTREAARYSSALRAHHSLRAWADAIAGDSLADPPTPGAGKPVFPYAEVVSAVRESGIRSLASQLVESIGDAARLAARYEVSGFTPAWLACLADMTCDSPSYASYTQFPLFEQYCRAGDFLARARSSSIALIADLARNELVSSTAPPSRIAAAMRLVTELCAEAAVTPAPSIESSGQARSACSRVLAEHLDRAPNGLGVLLRITPLPTTPAPDEYMFLRSVQSMELLAFIAAFHVTVTLTQPAPELSQLSAGLAKIVPALSLARRLFPVLATIDTAQFAEVRGATMGAGALQSIGFVTLERLCRGDLASRREAVDAVPIHQVPVPDRSLGRVIIELLPGLPARQAAHLRAAVAAVDKAWICWKRAHYGVTKRVIGDIPGTGGTSGIGYLKQHMNAPLLGVGDPM
jgi:ribosomal protein S18 acetylase RimI-like enzyme